MAAELCGAKLLAPVFGSSLYVWASVMGITLMALAAGYFVGGSFSIKPKPDKLLYSILNFAALFVLLMPLISNSIVPALSYISFLPAVVLSTVVLLFPPVFFLGASSPFFILIQTNKSEEAGKVSGTVYAVSTAGGILATFLCGFFLIPEIGLKACLLMFGGLLFALNFMVFKLVKPSQFVLLLAVMAYSFYSIKPPGKTLFESDGIMGHLEVIETLGQKGEVIRQMKVNRITQTEMDVKTRESVSEYINCLDSLIPVAKRPSKFLLMGLGGGLAANLLYKKGYEGDCVELDKRIIEAAKNHFFLNKSANVVCEDARYFMNNAISKYDIVVIDVFKAEEPPSHVITEESLEKLKTLLKDSAKVFINWPGFINGTIGIGTSIMYQTLIKSGFHVSLLSTAKDEAYRNIVFVASVSPIRTTNSHYVLNERPDFTTLTNTDDLPIVEKYNARANLAWRKSYLNYYNFEKGN